MKLEGVGAGVFGFLALAIGFFGSLHGAIVWVEKGSAQEQATKLCPCVCVCMCEYMRWGASFSGLTHSWRKNSKTRRIDDLKKIWS